MHDDNVNGMKGKVYKRLASPDVLVIVVYSGISWVIFKNVNQDNTQADEFSVNHSNDFALARNQFEPGYELVEAIDLSSEIG